MISEKLYKEIEQYCIVNKIEDIPKEVNNILQIGFNVIRFGMSPFQKPQIQEECIQNVIEEKFPPKKRGRKPKVIEVEKEEKKEEVVVEQPKKKVRIIKNK